MLKIIVVNGQPCIQGMIASVPEKSETDTCPKCDAPPRYALDASAGLQRIAQEEDETNFAYEADSSPESRWKGVSFNGLPVIVCGNCFTYFIAKPIEEIA